MSVKVTGVDSTMASLMLKVNNISSAVDRSIRQGALAVESEAIHSIQSGSKTGATYKSGKSKTHQASRAGEAPATDTGNLVSNIQAVKNMSGDGSWLVGSSLDYAKFLEFGTTMGGGHISPRPWLIPALESNRSWIDRNIQKAIRDQLR